MKLGGFGLDLDAKQKVDKAKKKITELVDDLKDRLNEPEDRESHSDDALFLQLRFQIEFALYSYWHEPLKSPDFRLLSRAIKEMEKFPEYKV